MRFLKSIMTLGLLLGIFQVSDSAFACGDYCDYGALYNTMGYGGYGMGSTYYDLASYSSSTNISINIDIGGGSSCGSYMGSCGSYTPSVCGSCGSGGSGTIDFGPSLYGDYYGNPYLSNPAMMGDPSMFNPASFTGNGSFMDPTTQLLMMSTLGMPMEPYQMTNIMSMMGPQTFAPFMQPPFSMYPFPGTNPIVNPYSMMPQIYPGVPNVGTMFPPSNPYTTPYTSPTTPTNPVVNPTINQPPTTPLVWGGCDNVIVMCPGGTVTRPPDTGTTPLTPPVITGTPQYQTTPNGPVRFEIPRNTH